MPGSAHQQPWLPTGRGRFESTQQFTADSPFTVPGCSSGRRNHGIWTGQEGPGRGRGGLTTRSAAGKYGRWKEVMIQSQHVIPIFHRKWRVFHILSCRSQQKCSSKHQEEWGNMEVLNVFRRQLRTIQPAYGKSSFSIHSMIFPSWESSHDVRRVGMTLISPKNSTSGFRLFLATGTTWNPWNLEPQVPWLQLHSEVRPPTSWYPPHPWLRRWPSMAGGKGAIGSGMNSWSHDPKKSSFVQLWVGGNGSKLYRRPQVLVFICFYSFNRTSFFFKIFTVLYWLHKTFRSGSSKNVSRHDLPMPMALGIKKYKEKHRYRTSSGPTMWVYHQISVLLAAG